MARSKAVAASESVSVEPEPISTAEETTPVVVRSTGKWSVSLVGTPTCVVEAADEEAAKEQYKLVNGIIRTIHPIVAEPI